MTRYLCKILGCSCPEPEPCRGTPRVQFRRHFVLIHPGVHIDIATTIFKEAHTLGRTIGFSADDAGMGDLNEKIVYAYGWPDYQALVDFFNTHYPGVSVMEMPLPQPQFFLVADVSASGQGVVSVESFELMRDKGIKGVYLRGPRGAGRIDVALQQNYINALDAGLLVGMYGVWFPTENPIDQAQNFLNVYNSYVWDLIPAGDFELSGVTNVAQSIQTYLSEINLAIVPTPMVYTRANWWNANVGFVNWAERYPLWTAGYPNPQGAWHAPSAYSPTFTPIGWATWKMWQFGIVAPDQFKLVGAEGLDMNWMRL